MEKILVVDDDKSIVEAVRFVLGREGYSIYSASNGKDGMAAARQEKPDLIILDFMMPGFDGHAVSSMLSQDPVLRRTPILILSATESARDLFKRLPNVRLYMNKPFDLSDLLKSVQQLLSAPPAALS